MRIEFGEYAQVFEDSELTNTPRSRSIGAIPVNPTGNAQAGSYFFLPLFTAAKIARHHWTAIPISDSTVARVEALELADGQPLIQPHGPRG